MQFDVLGPVAAVVEGRQLDLGTPRQRQLLGLLLLDPGATVSYDKLANDLWGGEPPGSARHTLQSYVHRLRRAFGSEGGRLETRPAGYALKVSDDEIDARRFERLASQARRAALGGDAQDASTTLDRALSLWRGTPYEDLGDLAAFGVERTRLEALRLTAVEDRIDAQLALGRHHAVLQELDRTLADEPFRERLWGQRMIALYRDGRQAEALETFQRARHLLDEELGIRPGRWLARLQEQILVQDPALDAPCASPPADPPSNLPLPRDSFVGRARHLAQLDGLLRQARLVTITGPPGVGKTRLAVEVADRLRDEFPHGVFVVPLTPLDDPRLVPAAIADAVGLPLSGHQPAMSEIIRHLQIRRALLVVDNAEHLPGVAGEIGALLDTASGLTVLVTSRTPLRLTGEHEHRLPPLPVPDHGATAAHDDAVALFEHRAHAVDPNFRLDEATRPVVADIVRRLDGLPLAIELAAARLRVFTVHELHRGLSSLLPVLTRGPVDSPPHHRTLRDAIAWSDDLLDPPARTLLRRLAAFRGEFTLDAARAVTTWPPLEDVTEQLSDLIDAGLVQRIPDSDPARFMLLHTIREYAAEQLATTGEQQAVERRHVDFHAAFARQAAPELTRAGQSAWMQRLDLAHHDLLAALDRATARGDQGLALEMAADLWRYWQLRGHLAEGRRQLETVLAAAPDRASRARGRALIGLAGICYWQLDFEAAETAYRRARELARELDDGWWLELEALFGLVETVACHSGDLAEAEPLEAQFQALTADRDDPLAVGLGLATSQVMRLLADDLDGSRRYGELCLAGARQAGERWYELQVLRTLALTSLRQRRYDQAHDELQQCILIADELRDLPGLSIDLDRLAQVEALLGRHERACVLAGASDRLREAVGSRVTVAAFRWDQQPATDLARDVLDDVGVDRAWARGRTMELHQAIGYAQEPPARTDPPGRLPARTGTRHPSGSVR